MRNALLRGSRPAAPAARARGRAAVLPAAYAATIFAGAFLLFAVQPLIAHYILPWFGGAPAVWTTALLFFQGLLLGGYAYAHGSARALHPRAQAGLHAALLLLALLLLPIVPSEGWKPAGAESPTPRILLLLGATVGLPYLLLASTSPLLQSWWSRLRPGASPYRWYALSNAGSLLALLAYPLAIEPWWGRAAQARLWSGAFALFAVGSAACAAGLWRSPATQGSAPWRAQEAEAIPAPGRAVRALWVALPAAASALLLAVTNQISLDVAVTPVLWVLPLALYLLSFVLVFEREGWYRRALVLPLLVPALAAELSVLFAGGRAPLPLQLGIHAGVLFLLCLACHGELARLRPHPRRLTGYYLAIATGGVLGGVFVGLVAPRVFSGLFELHVALVACCALVLLALASDPRSRLYGGRPLWAWALLGLSLVFLGVELRLQVASGHRYVIAASRSFHGVLRVTSDGVRRALIHGTTGHGGQYLAADKRRWPTGYYYPASAVGLVFEYFYQRPAGGHFGVVGLGVGTLATYGRPGDRFRFYEIDPEVLRLARRHFSFLADSPARVEVALGDARLSLEREPAQAFDVLFLDAFSSHAVPAHLLTREAFEIYDRHLAPGGVLAVHVSNPHLDLEPVVRGAADELGMQALTVRSRATRPGYYAAVWLLLSRNRDFLETGFVRESASRGRSPRRPVLWTDDHADVLGTLKRRLR